MYATCRGEAHEVQLLAVLFSVGIGSFYASVFKDRAVVACAVNLYKVLVYHATSANVEVSHLRVAHLSVGQTYIFA